MSQVKESLGPNIKTYDLTQNSTGLNGLDQVWPKHKKYPTQNVWIGLDQFKFAGDSYPWTPLLEG